MKIYERICQDFKDDIVAKRIKQGERLPSLITISKKYNCSKGTVIKAFEQLRSQHVIFSKPQSGYYVADNLMREEGSREGYYLDSGNPVIGSFSIVDVHQCLAIAAEMYSTHSLDLSLRGTSSLNEELHDYLVREDIYTAKENIYLVQGITQMLTHLTLSPFPNGKNTILIEAPSSRHYVAFLKRANKKVLTIKRDESGIDLDILEKYFKEEDIKFFYVVTRNHNPLGTSLDYRQRKRIMELAIKYNVYIIEDDYFGNMHKLPKYTPLYFFSYQKNCIYLRSMSKVLPLIRIAVVVIPSEFRPTFAVLSQESYYYSYHMPDLISQATYEAYLKSSIYEKHCVQINQLICEKLKVVREFASSWESKYVSLIGAESGYYFTLSINSSVKASKVIAELMQRKVYVLSNKGAFYNLDEYDNSIRLSIARISLEHLKEALEIIYETVQELMS
ncbi:MAG: PLP-dependent aminotransferase family protein [Oscillospiraceae bacterium]|nr:PLP-dependent aminotransferase family protein [Oscillospiraceae bacterium]